MTAFRFRHTGHAKAFAIPYRLWRLGKAAGQQDMSPAKGRKSPDAISALQSSALGDARRAPSETKSARAHTASAANAALSPDAFTTTPDLIPGGNRDLARGRLSPLPTSRHAGRRLICAREQTRVCVPVCLLFYPLPFPPRPPTPHVPTGFVGGTSPACVEPKPCPVSPPSSGMEFPQRPLRPASGR